MKNSVFVLLMSLACAGSTVAAPKLDDKVRTLIEQKVAAGEFPSLVVALREGNANAVYAFGKVGAAAPDGRTVYEIGSVTKTFTALLLAQEVLAGKVKLDDPVGKLVPDYAGLAKDGRQLTLRDLATQSSGLPRLPGNLSPKDMANPYVGYDRAALKAYLAGYALMRMPGSEYEYSNLGTGLLGDLLAELEQKSYPALIAERITGPLDMTRTGMGDLSPMLQTSAAASGHDAFGKPVPNWNFDALAGAGALHSSADDMLRYLQAMMDGASAKAPTSPFKLVQTAQRSTGMADMQIGLNWHLSKREGKVLVWHNGMTGGYASFIGLSSDGERGVVVLANTARPVDQIALAALFPETAAPAPALTLTPALLASYAGSFELSPGFVLTIKPVASGLSVQATGQPAFSASASGNDTFQVPEVGASLIFRRNSQGEVDGVTLRQNGRELPGRKL